MSFVVWATFDDAPLREVEPRSIVCDTVDEMTDAIIRAVAAGAFVTIEAAKENEGGERDPDLDNWPAERHIRQRTRGEIVSRGGGTS